jgi:citrate lyase subunit beta/citryl-CoA lyase
VDVRWAVMIDRPEHPPMRSLLLTGLDAGFASFEDARAAGADALFIDLEDPYVPFTAAEMDRQRAGTRSFIESLSADDAAPLPFVRVHALSTGKMLGDLRAVLVPGLAGVILPHVDGPSDVQGLAAILTAMELDLELPAGELLILPILETAGAYRNVFEIAQASPRVDYMGPLIAPHGDTRNALDYVMTEGGEEVVELLARSVVDARAGGVGNPIAMCALPGSFRDDDHVRAGLVRLRNLGYTGTMTWDPQHVPIANEVFSPSGEQITRWREIVRLYDLAEQADEVLELPPELLSRGRDLGGASHAGRVRPYIVDEARLGLRRARRLGLDGEEPAGVAGFGRERTKRSTDG